MKASVRKILICFFVLFSLKGYTQGQIPLPQGDEHRISILVEYLGTQIYVAEE